MCSFRITQSIVSEILKWRKEYPFSSIHGGSDGSPAHFRNNHCVWWDKVYWLESWGQERQAPFSQAWELARGHPQEYGARNLPILGWNMPLFPLRRCYPKCGLWATSISITREPEDFWAPTETHWIRNPVLIVFHVLLCVLNFENHFPFGESLTHSLDQLSFFSHFVKCGQSLGKASLIHPWVPDDWVSKAPGAPHAEAIFHPRNTPY